MIVRTGMAGVTEWAADLGAKIGAWLGMKQYEKQANEEMYGSFGTPPVIPPEGYGTVPAVPDMFAHQTKEYFAGVEAPPIPPEPECGVACWLNKNQTALLAIAGVLGVFALMPSGSSGRRKR